MNLEKIGFALRCGEQSRLKRVFLLFGFMFLLIHENPWEGSFLIENQSVLTNSV